MHWGTIITNLPKQLKLVVNSWFEFSSQTRPATRVIPLPKMNSVVTKNPWSKMNAKIKNTTDFYHYSLMFFCSRASRLKKNSSVFFLPNYIDYHSFLGVVTHILGGPKTFIFPWRFLQATQAQSQCSLHRSCLVARSCGILPCCKWW